MKVLGVEEEEYCYIPMGGELPDLAQRVVGFGGAANMVHPATGIVICTVQYSTVLFCTAYCTVFYCTVLLCALFPK